MPPKILNGLSFDVEEFFQAHNLARAAPPGRWDTFQSRVDMQVDTVLETLQSAPGGRLKATFFFLGWVAERHPDMVRKVAGQGHEIASHGYGHQFIYRQSQSQFRDDLRKSLAILENIAGQKVQGYRAPSFSITRDCLWALDIIKEEGLSYDSSLFPVYLGNRGGVMERFTPHRIRAGLCEIPVASLPVMGLRIPLSGGFYFRFYPSFFTRRGIRSMNRRGESAVLYFHPWEFDPEQPKLAGIPAFSRFRHYVNLKTNLLKLKSMLSSFQWAPLKEIALKYRNEI